IYNTFDPEPPAGDRDNTRLLLGIDGDTRLLLQPTRALPRKNVAAGVALASEVGGTFWLMGPAEDGYGPELDGLIAEASCPVILGSDHAPIPIDDAYAACDVVLLPSTWEGFGNPSVESATHRRPLAIGPYPVASELAAFGFQWFDSDDGAALARWLRQPDRALLDHNHSVAARHFNVHDLPERLDRMLSSLPGTP
ncbi:MAG TPA: hypothetical protein VGH31_02805, partial [Acidimicrobiales bacterium]